MLTGIQITYMDAFRLKHIDNSINFQSQATVVKYAA